MESQTKILKLDPISNTFVVEKVVLTVAGSSKPYFIEKDIIQIGSDPQCDLVIPDDYVSSQHCELKKLDSGFMITDLGSTNGTFLKGIRVQKAYLNFGDVFTLGKTDLVFNTQNQNELVSPLSENNFCGIVGKSQVMRQLYTKISRVAPTCHNILILGETGSGKECVARAVYELSLVASGPYVVLNCGAISPNLIESELFGHEKGAFTGAQSRHLGAFERAGGGTLFLDEIGELPLELQPKLLRVLENQTIRRVGGDDEIPVKVRVLAATHRNLAENVKNGKFREDLFYRLYIIPIFIPPLRDRKEDIPLLVGHFIEKTLPDSVKKISPAVLKKLSDYLWPGNVRELKNVIMRSLVFCQRDTIMPEDIDFLMEPKKNTQDPMNLDIIEREKIEEALDQTSGNKSQAARLLGIAKSTLFKKIKELGI